MATDYDVQIDGTWFRIARQEGGYREVTRRDRIVDQEIASSVSPGTINSPLNDVMLQTDWSQGLRWENPLLRVPQDRGYYYGGGWDTFSEPGKIKFAGELDLTEDSAWKGDILFRQHGSALGTWDDDIFTSWGDSITLTATGLDHPSAGLTLTAATYVNSIWDAVNEKTWLLSSTNLQNFGSGIGAAVTTVSLSPGITVGAQLMIYEGKILLYNGDVIKELTDPYGTPSQVTFDDDGHGVDWLYANLDTGSGRDLVVPETVNLALADERGIVYVKNVNAGGQPKPFVYRLDRQTNGTYIRVPVAALPAGTVALSIHRHLDSIVISATPEIEALARNVDGHFAVDLWHVTGGNVGVLGRVFDGTDLEQRLDESPWRLMGSRGHLLFVGGRTTVYVYDAIRGGIHPLFRRNDSVAIDTGVWKDVHFNYSGAYFMHDEGIVGATGYWAEDSNTAGATVSTNTLGTDYDKYRIESNLFDFGNPLDLKRIERIHIDASTAANSRLSILISTDRGSTWTVAGTVENESRKTIDLTSTSFEGYEFMYALAYENSSGETAAGDIRMISFEASTGEMTTYYQLILDGTEFLNVDNEAIDPAQVEADLRTLAAKKNPFNVTFNFKAGREGKQETRTVRCRLENIEMVKSEPAEFETINVTLVEM